MNHIVLDIETTWDKPQSAHLVTVAVTYDDANAYRTWYDGDTLDLIDELLEHDRIVGFNLSFDFSVLASALRLAGYSNQDVRQLKAQLNRRKFDLLRILQQSTRRTASLSLSSVAEEVLGMTKLVSTSSLRAAQHAGNIGLVTEHCQRDVELTRGLYDELAANGNFFFEGQEVTTDADF